MKFIVAIDLLTALFFLAGSLLFLGAKLPELRRRMCGGKVFECPLDQLWMFIGHVCFFADIFAELVELDTVDLVNAGQIKLNGFPLVESNGPFSTLFVELPVQEFVFFLSALAR